MEGALVDGGGCRRGRSEREGEPLKEPGGKREEKELRKAGLF